MTRLRYLILILIVLSNRVFAMETTPQTTEPERSNVYLSSGEFRKLHEEGVKHLADNPNKSYRIALDLQRLAIKSDKVELIFLADFFLGRCYYFFNSAPKAIKVFETANKIASQQKWVDAQIKINIFLGSTFSNKRSYVLTEKYYMRALKMAKAYKKDAFILDIYERIGFLQVKIGTHESDDKGTKYFYLGLNYAKKVKDTVQMAIFYSRLGLLGDHGLPTKKSIGLIYRSIYLLKMANKKDELILPFKSLGDSYYSLGKNDSSLFYYLEVYKLHRQTGQARIAAISAADVAYMYGSTGNIKLLNTYADTALFYARRDKTGEGWFYVYRWLADVYENVGKFEVSNKYYKAQAHLLDSTLKSGNGEALTTAGMQSDFDGKLEVLQMKQAREREMRKKEKEEQTFRSRIYLIGFFVVLVFLIIIFREFRINKKQRIIISQQHESVSSQKVILEVKNKEITDSINYALRIQSALLPNPTDLTKLLDGSFIYYAPKDIVSGDFYWFYKRENDIYIACGDCTGHGVPGALMSVLGINLLTDIIDGNKANEPAKILDYLRVGIIRSLNKDNETGLYKDGMDLALIKINTQNSTCTFAGANNPVYHISNGSLTEYKASSQPVGYSHKQDPFMQTEFKIAKNDFIILFTDGFADQFGGTTNKKFMYKRFKEILTSSIANSQENIDVILKEHFLEWKGGVEQVDDVCVIGVKI